MAENLSGITQQFVNDYELYASLQRLDSNSTSSKKRCLTLTQRKRDEQESWISVSDLMAGLMMVFLFIAIIYAKDADKRATAVTEVVTEWQQLEEDIYNALESEFGKDLEKWNAEIEKDTLTVRFLAPEILFESGSDVLKPQFKDILSDFMPRYIVLLITNFVDDISEVRIEGHTSSEWNQEPEKIAFIKNMDLSKDPFSIGVFFSKELDGFDVWMRKTMNANGLLCQAIMKENLEDKKRSRRVEFAIRTKTRERLKGVLEKINPSYERKI